MVLTSSRATHPARDLCGGLLTVGILGALLWGCGAGTAAVAGGGGGNSTTTVEVVPTELTALAPSDGATGNVALRYFLQLDPSQTARLESVEFSLRGNDEAEFRPATGIAFFPTDLVAGETIDGAELATRSDPLLSFVWNSHFDLDQMRRAPFGPLIQRPVTARAVLRLTVRNLATDEVLIATTSEFYLDHSLVATIAGGGVGDGNSAKAASMLNPGAIFVDANGDLLVADTGNHRIRRIEMDGTEARGVRTLVGNGFGGVVQGVAPARNTSLAGPVALAATSQGNLFLAERDDAQPGLLRVVDEASGLIVPLTDGFFMDVSALAVMDDRLLFVADAMMGEVWRIPIEGFEPLLDGLDMSSAVQVGKFSEPVALAAIGAKKFGGVDRLYVVDNAKRRVRRVDDGVLVTQNVLGGGSIDPASNLSALIADETPGSDVRLTDPVAVAADRDHIFVADAASDIVLVLETNAFTVVNGFVGVENPSGLALDGEGNLIVVEGGGLVQAGNDGHEVLIAERPEVPGAVLVPLAAGDSMKGISQALDDITAQVEALDIEVKTPS